MSITERRETARDFARRLFVEGNQTARFNLDELRDAVVAIDEFLDANAAAVNAAFPASFRASATSLEKAAIVAFCAMRRAGLL